METKTRKPVRLPEDISAREALKLFGLMPQKIENSPSWHIVVIETGEIIDSCIWHFDWLREQGYIE